jgi:NitT/TauT family transport system permease protein
MSRNARRAFTNAAVLIAALIVAWQALYYMVGETALRSPLATGTYTVSLLAGEMLWPHARESLAAFAIALSIAVVAGLAIGMVLGYVRSAAEIFEPMLTALYSIPKITLYPILLLLFGLGMPAKVAFGAIHGIIPIAIFALNGVRNVRTVLIKAGRTMKLGRFDMARRVLFPAALPEIFTGLRIGFSLTLIGTLLGEMFASQRGVGFLMMNAIGLHNIDLIMALTLLIVIFSATVSSVLLYFDRRLRDRL